MSNTASLALRRLRRAPAASLTALATVTLAFAANVAMFSVVDGVVLRKLPFRDPDRLVRVYNHPEGNPDVTFEISWPEFLEVRHGLRGLTDVAGYVSMVGGLTVRLGDSYETLPGVAVSGNLFSVLGVDPVAGRAWTDADDVVGAEPVVAMSEGLWRRAFGGDPQLLGSFLEIGGQRHRVTTILPAGLEYPVGAELWIPVTSYLPASLLESPQIRYLNPVGRLADGTAPAPAASEWNALVDATVDARLPVSARSAVSLGPVAGELLGASRSALLFLWGAAGLILLIACVNVTNLRVVRALAERRDTAMRRALGADWGDIVRLSMWESVLLVSLGCASGALLGDRAVHVLLRALPVELYRSGAVGLDARGWVYAGLLALGTSVFVGLAPLFAAARGDLAGALRDGSARTVGRGAARRVLRGFVVAQTALAVLLLAGAALLVHGFARLRSEDPGFDAEQVLSFSLVQVSGQAPEAAAHDRMIEALVDRLEQLPEVRSAAGVLLRPLVGLGGFDASFTIEGRDRQESAGYPQVNYESATPGYFAALGVPLLEGRLLEASDDETAPQVAVISRAVARRFFPEGSAVGKRFKWGGAESAGPWVEIVGVVGEGRYRRMDRVSLDVFVAHRQTTWPLNDLVVATRRADPASVAEEVRGAVREAGFGVEATNLATLQQVVDRSLAEPRFQALLLGLFAGLALALGAVGLYGVVSYLLSVRRQEMGVRLALGARPRDVARLVLGEALGLTAAGAAVGLALGVALARLFATYFGATLYEVGVGDPLSLAVALVTLFVAALAAGLPPAFEAGRTNPIAALRDG